jgi:hypothetical protein
MAEFSHVVLTVFNVRLHFGGNTAPSREWLINRFELFERFCLPSMRGQSSKNFKWLVLFDSETTESYRERVASYAQWENFVPCFVDQVMTVDSFSQMKRDLIMEHVGGAHHLITTTLDNDDALGSQYVEIVQQHFSGQQFEFVNFANGYVLDHMNNKLYRKRDESSPFISLIEKVENFRTVWCAAHSELSTFGKIHQVETTPMWLQVVHGRNAINKVGNHRRIPIKSLDDNFALEFSYPDSENPTAMFLENMANRMKYVESKLLKRLRSQSA